MHIRISASQTHFNAKARETLEQVSLTITALMITSPERADRYPFARDLITLRISDQARQSPVRRGRDIDQFQLHGLVDFK